MNKLRDEWIPLILQFLSPRSVVALESTSARFRNVCRHWLGDDHSRQIRSNLTLDRFKNMQFPAALINVYDECLVLWSLVAREEYAKHTVLHRAEHTMETTLPKLIAARLFSSDTPFANEKLTKCRMHAKAWESTLSSRLQPSTVRFQEYPRIRRNVSLSCQSTGCVATRIAVFCRSVRPTQTIVFRRCYMPNMPDRIPDKHEAVYRLEYSRTPTRVDQCGAIHATICAAHSVDGLGSGLRCTLWERTTNSAPNPNAADATARVVAEPRVHDRSISACGEHHPVHVPVDAHVAHAVVHAFFVRALCRRRRTGRPTSHRI